MFSSSTVSLPGVQSFALSLFLSPIVSWWFERGREKENLEHVFLLLCSSLGAVLDCMHFFLIICHSVVFFFLTEHLGK